MRTERESAGHRAEPLSPSAARRKRAAAGCRPCSPGRWARGTLSLSLHTPHRGVGPRCCPGCEASVPGHRRGDWGARRGTSGARGSEGADRNHVRFVGQLVLPVTPQLCHGAGRQQRHYVLERAWLCANKTRLTKAGHGLLTPMKMVSDVGKR